MNNVLKMEKYQLSHNIYYWCGLIGIFLIGFFTADTYVPGIGPEHAYLHDIGRAEYVPVTDDEAVEAFEYLARTEGIICAIESAHAVAHAMKIAKEFDPEDSIIICLSGRGDKDVAAIARYRGRDLHE